ncbi:MAG: DUF4158 domain-containing protein, partial [Acetobacteraceae bacterium]|nr:DUF4158 domain-containing protein [Acetobacteraceae bacterium]
LNRLSVALQIGFLRMTGRMLNSCQIVPTVVLEHLGRQLDLVPPQLASIRGLYRRKRTLFDHQHVAMAALGFRYLTEHAERGLTAHLRRSAETTFSVDALRQDRTDMAVRAWLRAAWRQTHHPPRTSSPTPRRSRAVPEDRRAVQHRNRGQLGGDSDCPQGEQRDHRSRVAARCAAPGGAARHRRVRSACPAAARLGRRRWRLDGHRPSATLPLC